MIATRLPRFSTPLPVRESETLLALINVSERFEGLLGDSFPAYPVLKECIAGDIFSYDRRIARVRQVFFDDISIPFDLSTAGSLAGLEKHYFSVYFHNNVGLPFSRWRGICRSAFAAWLITQRKIPVSQLALEAGYENAQTLTRNFKREFAVSPRQFKSLHDMACARVRAAKLLESTPLVRTRQSDVSPIKL